MESEKRGGRLRLRIELSSGRPDCKPGNGWAVDCNIVTFSSLRRVRMIARYNNKSLLFGIPGIILQITGRVGSLPGAESESSGLFLLVMLAGTILLLIGLAYYAMAKGRHAAWCLFAFLSIIGLIVLACLKDKAT
ncbi:MAG: hypothetical protein JW959_05900 [Pirellulales bacterium]|nr:hypothetical protein [Pirellulales bacterium]